MTIIDSVNSTMEVLHEFKEATLDYFFIIGDLIRDLPRPWGPPQFTMNEVFDFIPDHSRDGVNHC